MKIIFNHFNLLLFSTFIGFLLYDRYLGFFIINLDIPFVPHMRTPEAAVLKYSPLIVFLFLQTLLMYKISTKKERETDGN